MLQRLIDKYSDRFVSKWIIFAGDILITAILFMFAYLIRFNFQLHGLYKFNALLQLPYALSVYLVGFLIWRPFSGIIRHTNLTDTVKIIKSISFAAFILAIATYFSQQTNPKYLTNVPFSIILIHYFLCAFFLINSRFLIKMMFYQITRSRLKKKNVLIYGAGSLGLITKNSINQDRNSFYRIVGFIEDNPSFHNKIIEGKRVYSSTKALSRGFIEKEGVDEVIIAIQNITVSRKRKIVNVCLNRDIKVKTVPAVEKWLNGQLDINKINDIKIEDLLGRDSILLDKKNIIDGVEGRKVLITGAAGSIGSEIVRQLIQYHPGALILLDKAESELFNLNNEIKPVINGNTIHTVIADISDRKRMHYIFEKFRPEIIFHAAAYKHVPLMEDNPYEAIKVNVSGTMNMADFAVQYGVKKFVMISTDKAVNPTNVMGASKRIAEIYTRCKDKLEGHTQFITTRFGNVLGSNGSVIPLFKRQIENGGPVTVTHPDIRRYFMTIQEACQLVLEAAFMGKGGEIYVFDMGESVKIIDLAKKMIKLSGLTLGKDIDIKITGLRAGEKLHEELLAHKEITKPTHHPKIMIGEVKEYDYQKTLISIVDILKSLKDNSDDLLVKKMKKVVPEYISNNSIYSKWDKQKAGVEN